MSVDAVPALPVYGDPLAADDPHGALRQALAAPLDPLLTAEDVVLGWLLHLPGDVDPALAANRILAASGIAGLGNERLSRLLTDIACWPADRLRHLQRRRLPFPT